MASTSSVIAASAIQQSDSVVTAVMQAFEHAAANLRKPISLIVVFYNTSNAPELSQRIASYLAEQAPDAVVIGCSAESVLGVGVEIEESTAASIFLLGGLSEPPRSFKVEYQPTADGPSIFGLPDELLDGPTAGSGLILLADPFTFPMDLLMQRVADEAPGLPILGGYSSGLEGPGDCGLILNREASCREPLAFCCLANCIWNRSSARGAAQ